MANRVLAGRRNNGAYGLYVSAPGQDVTSVTLPEHFLFNSDLAAGAVIHASGTLTRGSSASFAALPYVPIVMSWAIVKSNGQQAGRFQWNDAYTDRWYVPGLSEYEEEHHDVSVYGPTIHATTNTVSFPAWPSNLWRAPIPDNWNARYLVLRIPAS